MPSFALADYRLPLQVREIQLAIFFCSETKADWPVCAEQIGRPEDDITRTFETGGVVQCCFWDLMASCITELGQ